MTVKKVMILVVVMAQAMLMIPDSKRGSLEDILIRGDRAIKEKNFSDFLSLYPVRNDGERKISFAAASIVFMQSRLEAVLSRGRGKYGKNFAQTLGMMSMFVEIFALPVRLKGWEDSGRLTESENVASLVFEVKQVGNERINRVIRFRKIDGRWFLNPYIAKEDGTDVLTLHRNLKQLVGYCNMLLDQNLSLQSFGERIQPVLEKMGEI